MMAWHGDDGLKAKLLRQLQDWCVRAEQSDIAGLKRFSQVLRSYA